MSTVKIVFWLRLATLVGLCLPALDLAWRWYTDDLGARVAGVVGGADADADA